MMDAGRRKFVKILFDKGKKQEYNSNEIIR